MPDPIGSRIDDYTGSRNFSSDEDLTCHDDPHASLSTSDAEHGTSLSSDARADMSRPESGIRGPHAEAHAENGDLYAGAFALRERDAASGIDIEVLSASAHASEREAAAQVGMARMGKTMFGGHVTVSGEVFTAQTHAGCDNPDGSTGFGASAGATVVGGEVTLSAWGWSVTGGASLGTTVGASLGVRDSDHDGKIEDCRRVDFGVGSLGVCVEEW